LVRIELVASDGQWLSDAEVNREEKRVEAVKEK